MKRHDKTTHKQIAEYYINLTSPPVDEHDLNFKFRDSHTVCFNCGETKQTERCHIIPHSLGGNDTPSNYVLLCGECHEDAPNNTNDKYMWEFFKANKFSKSQYPSYTQFKACEYFKQRKGYSFGSILGNVEELSIPDAETILKGVNIELKRVIDNTQRHGFNTLNITTWFTIYCQMEDYINLKLSSI